jgi:TonB family protein
VGGKLDVTLRSDSPVAYGGQVRSKNEARRGASNSTAHVPARTTLSATAPVFPNHSGNGLVSKVAPEGTSSAPTISDAVPVVAYPGADETVTPLAKASRPVGVSVAKQGLDEEELRSFKLALTKVAARYKWYPPVARERGIEGVVSVRVSIGESGQDTLDVAVIRPSGEPILDHAALQMMWDASRRVETPPQLRGQVFWVVVPVDYRLGD